MIVIKMMSAMKVMIIGGQRSGGRAAPANLGNLGNLGTGVSDFSCQSWPTTPKFPAQTCLKTTTGNTNNADETLLKCYTIILGDFLFLVCGEIFCEVYGKW